jgi:hypothetical protein
VVTFDGPAIDGLAVYGSFPTTRRTAGAFSIDGPAIDGLAVYGSFPAARRAAGLVASRSSHRYLANHQLSGYLVNRRERALVSGLDKRFAMRQMEKLNTVAHHG